MASVSKRPWTSPTTGEKKEAWIVRYKDKTGVQRQRTFKRKKEADQFRAKTEHELTTGEHVARGEGVRLEKAASLFLADLHESVKRGAQRIGTYVLYEHEVRLYVLPEFGQRFAHEIETADVEAWVRRMQQDRKLAAKTIRSKVQRLKSIIDLAIRYKWARANPVLAMSRSLLAAPAKSIRTFEIDEVRQLLRAAAEKPKGYQHQRTALLQCFVVIAAFCGLRYGEIAGLQIGNLDLDRGIIRVRSSLSGDGVLQPPKTVAGKRDVRMPTNVATLLRAYVERFPPAQPDGLVFTTNRGKHLDHSSFYTRSWCPLVERAGLGEGDQFHFHALRHFAGSFMIENGWPLPDVSAALGHANVNITLAVYAHSLEKRSIDLSAVDALAARLGGLQPPAVPLLVAA